jgi:hypothetical protein
MKSQRFLGFAVSAAVLAFGVSASAFAATTQWLVGGATVSSAVKADGVGNVTLEETNTGLAVTCEESLGKGTIGSGTAGKVESVTLSKCKAVKGRENVEAVSAAGLPWTTELVLSGTKFQGLLSKGGYTIKCRLLGIPFSTTCTKEDALGDIENLTSTVRVLADTEEEATCTSSGKPTGLVHGSGEVLTEGGAAPAVSEA